MNFIERLFGVSPDGGSGILELSLLATPLTLIVLVRMTRYVQRKTRVSSPSCSPDTPETSQRASPFV
jgi:hypothetical protein